MSDNYKGSGDKVVNSAYLHTQLKALSNKLKTLFADKTLEHEHTNKTNIDKIGEDVNGDLTYNGSLVNGTSQAFNDHIADTDIHITKEEHTDINNHIIDNVRHVTQEEKDSWNSKYLKPTSGIPIGDLGNSIIDEINKKSNTDDIIEASTGKFYPSLINEEKISHLKISDIGTKSHNELEQILNNHVSNTTIHNSKTLNAITIQNIDFLSGTFTNCIYDTTNNVVELIKTIDNPPDPYEYTKEQATYTSKIWDTGIEECPWVSYSWLGDYNNDYTNIVAYVRVGSTEVYDLDHWSEWKLVPYTKALEMNGRYIQTKFVFSTSDKNKNIILKNIIMYYGVDLADELTNARPSLNGDNNANLKQRLDKMETAINGNTSGLASKLDNSIIANSTTLGLVKPEDKTDTDASYTMEVKVDADGRLWGDANAQLKIDSVKTDNAIQNSSDGYYVKDYEKNIDSVTGDNALINGDNGLYVKDLSGDINSTKEDIDEITKNQQMYGKTLDWGVFKPSVNQNLSNITPLLLDVKINGNMECNGGGIQLKADRTYFIIPDVKGGSVNGSNIKLWSLSTNSQIIDGVCNADTVVYNASWIYKPKEDEVISFMLSSVTSTTSSGISVIVFEIGRTYIPNVIEEIKNTPEADKVASVPIGTIQSFMRKTAPENYLICDGSTYNISDYPELTQVIIEEFGASNYWGGDGINTFAVPNLNGEFLRGYSDGTNSATEGVVTTEVGKHQDGSSQFNVQSNTNYSASVSLLVSSATDMTGYPSNANFDTTTRTAGYVHSTANRGNDARAFTYTTRPTNTAVLYCIKAKPTTSVAVQKVYGGFDESVLWSGSANSGTLTLSDDISNYDAIVVYFSSSGDKACLESNFITKEIINSIPNTPAKFIESGFFNTSYYSSIRYDLIKDTLIILDGSSSRWTNSCIVMIVGLKTKQVL